MNGECFTGNCEPTFDGNGCVHGVTNTTSVGFLQAEPLQRVTRVTETTEFDDDGRVIKKVTETEYESAPSTPLYPQPNVPLPNVQPWPTYPYIGDYPQPPTIWCGAGETPQSATVNAFFVEY